MSKPKKVVVKPEVVLALRQQALQLAVVACRGVRKDVMKAAREFYTFLKHAK